MEEEFPLILSPNLGCPKIVSVKELIHDKIPIDIILAGQYGEFIHPTQDMFKEAFKLVPSYPEDVEKEISLDVNDIKEITGWNRLFDFSSTEETQRLINSELHYNILGEGTKYWLIKAVPKTDGLKEYEYFLKKGEGKKWIPTLYDLIFIDKSLHKKINYHAVQFVETFEKDLNFIHLTDLHIAQRNDDILGEVLKKLEKGTRGREEIKKNYINFNDNLRRFIHIANELADKGKLDFIVITGDIVDFSGNGWDDYISPAENSWKVFLDIMTGHDAEGSRGFRLQKDDSKDEFNHGIKVAIFTSTGNHDWRLHPYSLISYIPGQSGKYGEFGLKEEEAKNFKYNSFDSSKYPTDKRKTLSDALTKESLKRLNLDALDDKWSVKIAKGIGLLKVNLKESIIASGLIGAGMDWTTLGNKYLPGLLLAGVVGAGVPVLINYVAEHKAKKLADILVDNPLHADVVSLHYYFTHINPYFDYAFSFGDNHFILMDTGADVVTIRADELMDGVVSDDLKKVSIQDNFLGSSPDSIAFDDRQAYYNWEQIVWLDKVLSTISKKKYTMGRGRTFICLHAPPINPDPKCDLDALREKILNRYISKDECNLTYGTINHYLSQFFFLCSGKRENPHRKIDPEADSDLDRIDLVLSGHAHIDVEFRVNIQYDESLKENKIRIYHDTYSEKISEFDEKKPIMVQTASCGPPSEKDKKAPSWRMIRVNKQNLITGFEHESLDAWLKKENKPIKHNDLQTRSEH